MAGLGGASVGFPPKKHDFLGTYGTERAVVGTVA